MKLLLPSLLIGLGLYVMVLNPPRGPVASPAAAPVKVTPVADEETAGPEPAEDMVRIQGKWYKYRSDNRYVVDGVPTLHIAKRPEHKAAVIKAPDARPAAVTPATDKPEALARMANENPLAVYTPEGFKTLQEGLKAAQEQAAERKKALEALTAE